MERRSVLGALMACLLLTTGPAAAQTDAEPPPARAVAGFGAVAVSQQDLFLLRERFHLGGEFTHESRLTISPFVRLYATHITLHRKDGMPLDLELTLPWQPVAGGRVEYLLAEPGAFSFSVRAEFETPLMENRAEVGGYVPYDDLVDAPIDGAAVSDALDIRHMWRGASATIMASYRIGRFRPRIEAGYLLLESSLAVSYDAGFGRLLDSVDISPDRFYDDGISAPFYALGADVDLGLGFELRASGTVIPTGKTIFTAAECSIAIPVDTDIF